MATTNRYQQQSLHRKLIYFVLIVGLLTLGWLVRYRSLRVGGTEVGIVAQATRANVIARKCCERVIPVPQFPDCPPRPSR